MVTERPTNPGDNYEQSGNLGMGNFSGGEIKDNAKVAGKIEEAPNQTTSVNIQLPSQSHRKIDRPILNGIAQLFIQWMPVGISGFLLLSFLRDRNWTMASIAFLLTIFTLIWALFLAKYMNGFFIQLGEVAQQRGKEDVDGLLRGWQNLDEAIRWQLAKTEEKYLRCQGNDCQAYITEGLDSHHTFKPSLEDVFVPLELSGDFWRGMDGDCLPMPPGLKWDKKMVERLSGKEGLSIWDVLAQARHNSVYRRLAIQAWGGYGKTTLLRHITYTYTHKYDTHKRQFRRKKSNLRSNLSSPSSNAPQLLPVLLYLRVWQETIYNQKPDLPTLVERYHLPKLPEGKDLKLPPNWAKQQLRQGKMLVMFDGFDEVRSEWQESVSEWIAKEMNDFPNTFFILTSRPAGYKKYIAENKPNSLFVKPLNDDLQQQFVRRWYLSRERYDRIDSQHPKIVREIAREAEAKASGLVRQLQDRSELNDLAKNPLLLNIIVNLHYHAPCDPLDSSRSIQLPQRRAELYRDIFDLQLKERPKVKDVYRISLSPEDSQKVLQKLALYMVRENQPNIEYQPLLEQLKIDLSSFDESISSREFLKQIEQVSELLVKRDDQYEFAHLSFQGYLAALEIKERQQEQLLLEHCQEPWWKETILLYAAQISAPQLSHLIRQLCDVRTRDAVALAYQCLQESPRKVSPEVEAQLQQLKSSVQDLRYQKLEQHLQNGEWKQADEETFRLMLQTVEKEEGQWLNSEDIDNFPCEDLRILDRLWVDYSKGRFGFSVQKNIYQSLGGTREYNEKIWNAFGDRVGWRVKGYWLYYKDLTFDLGGSEGHLPVLIQIRLAQFPAISGNFRELFSRVQTCEL